MPLHRTGCELLLAPLEWLAGRRRPKKFDETHAARRRWARSFAPFFPPLLFHHLARLFHGYTRRTPQRDTLTHYASVRYRRCPVRRRLDCARPVVECVIQSLSPHSVPFPLLFPPSSLARASVPQSPGIKAVYRAKGDGASWERTARTVRADGPEKRRRSFNKPKGIESDHLGMLAVSSLYLAV